MDQSNDKLVERQEKPDVPELAKEYVRSLHDGYSLTKVSEADNVRLTRWDGQSDDGKKHSENLNEGKQAFRGKEQATLVFLWRILLLTIVLMS